jgi:cell division protein FtsZ
MSETNLINEYVQEMAGNNADLIFGVAVDPEMDDQLSVTVIATGFKTSSIPEMNNGKQPDKEKVSLIEDNAGFYEGFKGEYTSQNSARQPAYAEAPDDKKDEIISQLYPPLRIDPFAEGQSESAKKFMQVNFFNESEDYIEELSKIPAYERRRMKNQNKPNSGGNEISRYSLSNDPGEGMKLRKNNSFLHDKAD